MKRRLRIMQTFSKEGIIINKSQRRMNSKDMYFQEELIPPCIKEASIKDNIVICQGMN
jgi:hypothetical protein